VLIVSIVMSDGLDTVSRQPKTLLQYWEYWVSSDNRLCDWMWISNFFCNFKLISSNFTTMVVVMWPVLWTLSIVQNWWCQCFLHVFTTAITVAINRLLMSWINLKFWSHKVHLAVSMRRLSMCLRACFVLFPTTCQLSALAARSQQRPRN